MKGMCQSSLPHGIPKGSVASTWSNDFNASSELTFLGRDSQINLDHFCYNTILCNPSSQLFH